MWRSSLLSPDISTGSTTGEKVIGIGDGSGMIPVNPETKNYDATMVEKFDNLIADKGFSWKLEDVLPKVLLAGENAEHTH